MKSKKKKKSSSEFSELKFLDVIEKKFKYKDKDLIIGIGDDAAVLKFKNGNIIATTDMMVENVHFNLKYFSMLLLLNLWKFSKLAKTFYFLLNHLLILKLENANLYF